MLFPVAEQCSECGQRLRRQVMLDVFDLPLDGLGPQTQQGEERGERVVPVFDVGRDGRSLRGESEAPVALVVDEPPLGEPAHHVGDRGRTEPQRLGQIADPGIPVALDQFLDALQMVFGRFRAGGGHASGFVATAHGNRVQEVSIRMSDRVANSGAS